MKKIPVLLYLLFLLFRMQAQQRFEPEIRTFESLDSAEHPATGQILLYGSSTMRLWKTFSQDLTGFNVVNRGFGGSEMSDAIYFFDRVVVPLQPSLILLYEGDNDISNGKKTPEQVFEDFKTFMAMVAEKLPETRVAVYSLRPSIARERLMPEQRLVNDSFKKYCQENSKKAFFIDLYETLLTESGLPNAEFLAVDKLHLNEKGYAVWTKATRDFLERNKPQ
ncbi:MAG TPA: GDSL-type esterase/lipase family protein [Saprospiraceae bacterium]|nr:GDSL-type esterase/lipase family protein [Saprospiraceae bacterium]HPI06593.1 GDSL-type esterase/lipase family protein [Saprospiraceae bacterium]